MTCRSFYQLLVRMHPPAFRGRFGDQMISVFDEAGADHTFDLIFDGLLSFTRQWLLRTDSWKLLVAVCGGYIQVFGFGVPIKGHQYWAENQQALTPSMEQVILFALALVCSLFVVITFMSLWNTRFMRRRSVTNRSFRSALSIAHHWDSLQAPK